MLLCFNKLYYLLQGVFPKDFHKENHSLALVIQFSLSYLGSTIKRIIES